MSSGTALLPKTGHDSVTVVPERSRDWSVAAAFTVLAVAVMHNQWQHLGDGYLRNSGQDQTMWEWFFAVAAHSVTHLDNPVFSNLQNTPLGVNLMANTAMLGLSIPLAPITLLFGPTATFTLALTLGLATTAFGWYFLFSRTVVQSRVAAALGGLLCGFGPGMISHANAHPNFVFLGVLPLITLLLVRITQGLRIKRNAVFVGLLTAWQVMMGEEPLLIFAITLAVFGVVFYLGHPRAIVPAMRRLIPAGLVAAVITAALIAVPLWWQFYGPQSYKFLDHNLRANDLKSITSLPPQSLGGRIWPGPDYSINLTEQNAYFGVPLLVLSAVCAVYLWRSSAARAATITALVVGVLSLGPVLTVDGVATDVTLPGKKLHTYPLLESVLETRYALAAVPVLALLVALATDRVLRRGAASKALWTVALLVALVPLVPVPPPVAAKDPAPAFFADGAWRDYVSDGSVVTVPLPGTSDASPLRWQYESNFDFPIAAGYFVGPGAKDPEEAKYGAVDRQTAILLGGVADSGDVVAPTPEQMATARTDLEFWNADVVVLPPGKNVGALRETLNDLLGFAGAHVDGSWVWDVRGR
ncbi:glycosyl transferase [Rhodococcoides trifolii]|uniref:Glycosyl transferase n=1 Tax=Rhodococcoides trifolii TaxID=908250 RepID=A0A917CJA6_9NOCA|nr:6-pyruvoyl-tetrahydropterin synthase-related protein [Rhodococcus trifolii]GGF90190.1 glycosyl transferase [Rhodococcus trifolii]